MPYIYKITNKINNKVYVGKTLKTIEERWKEHTHDYLKRQNEKRPLYSAMKKYGIENFYIEQLEETSEELVNEREVYWIETLGSFKYGYNATIGGDGKAYLDRELLIKTYLETKNIKQTAKLLNIDAGNLSKILKSNNIEILSQAKVAELYYGKSVAMLDKNTKEIIRTFPSLSSAAIFIKENYNVSACQKAISTNIGRVARGKRNSAHGFSWKFI